jgi:hypothetical protein
MYILSMWHVADIEEAFHGIFANFPLAGLGTVMRAVTFPTGATDRQTRY